MLSQVEATLSTGGALRRAGASAAIGVLALALGACSMIHRLTPGSETGAEVKNPPGASASYPHLGEVPDRPKQEEASDSRRKIAKGLVADREAAHYTDEALRGGTEASAPPPPPPVAALPATGAEATGALGEGAKMADNKAEPKKPGFFSRLFGAKEEPAPKSNEPAPLPARPTGSVDVQPAPATK
jgi:hypothetical protein